MRWYNNKRKKIWTVLIGIIGVIIFIQTLNNYYKNNNNISSSTNESTTTYNTTNYAVVTKTKINENVSENSLSIIDNFFNLCNEKKAERAYSLLSDDCKNELYPTINDFKTKYLDIFFTEKRSYESTLWITTVSSNTYRLEIYGDMLAKGKKDAIPTEDYFTIVYENGSYKLNIHRYIGKKDINKSKTQNNITINIISKKTYIDYEIYEIKVENKNKTNIVLNNKQRPESIYLVDENNVKYYSYINEITDNEFELSMGQTKIYNIRFNRGYKPKIEIKEMIFEDVNGKDTIKIDI